MKRYKKAPAFMGKVLTLFVGNGDRRILDHEVLEGAYWQKFVDQGFLVPLDESEAVKAPAPAPAPVKKEEPAPVKVAPVEEKAVEAEPKDDEGTMTKSSASKMAKIMGKRGKTSTKKEKK